MTHWNSLTDVKPGNWSQLQTMAHGDGQPLKGTPDDFQDSVGIYKPALGEMIVFIPFYLARITNFTLNEI